MDKKSDSDSKKSAAPPAPEVLKPQADEETPSSTETSVSTKAALHPRHVTYRPSHRATFIGLGVVAIILLVNVGIIWYLMQSAGKNNSEVSIGGVKISPAVLDTLGVSRNTVGDSGAELLINPNAKFGGTVLVTSDVTIGGQLKLSGKLNVADASITTLEAGKTLLNELVVNGDTTTTNLNLRKDLAVAGSSHLQGPVTMDQLVTLNGGMNVSGNLAVGGVLSIGAFSTNTLTVSGHILTRGAAPSVSPGGSLGMNGTVSISGNDAAGTVAVNIGAGGGSGTLASISFTQQYTSTPHVMVTAATRGAGSVYVTRNASGFTIGVNNAIAAGGYIFDYIVMQ
jgi:cytoskeletal protein CcmA (bactofilin family)